MATNSAEIFIAGPDRIVGAVMYAPTGTILPTDVAAAPGAAFVDGGYIEENGLKLAQTQTWIQIRDWNGDIVRSFESTYDPIFSWTYLETNKNAASAFWGAQSLTVTAPTATTGTLITVKGNSQETPRSAWCFNMKDGTKKGRLVVPQGQISKRGDLVFTKKGALTYAVELTAYPDELGNNFYYYTDDGIFTP